MTPNAHSMTGRLGLAGLLMFLGLAFAATARASTFTVTNLDDAGMGSLRQAIIDANSDPSPSAVVDFAPGVQGVLNLTSGPLAITGSMTIKGPGATVLDVDGDGSQIITVSASSRVSISGLELSAGHITAPNGAPANGGAIDNSGTLSLTDVLFDHNSAGTVADPTNDSGRGNGGAIYNDGTLTVSDSTFTENTAGGDGGAGVDTSQGDGGAIASTGSLTVIGTTFTGNQAGGAGGTGDGGGQGVGGALAAFGPTTLTDDTVTANTAGGAGGVGSSGLGIGAGIYIDFRSTATLQSDTIDGNTVGAASGSVGSGIVNQGTTSVIDTIVSGNLGAANCTNNVVGPPGTMVVRESLEGPAGQTSCGFDLRSADPLLRPLAANGGPTETQALGAGSPAIGAVAAGADCPLADQRGALRPHGGCDVGAFEVAPPFIGAASATSSGLTTATLDASVLNPDVFAGTVSFQYGTSTAYGTTTPSQTIPAGGAPGAYAASLSGLAPGTTYHYRVVATNPDGTTFGPDEQFTTGSPSVPAPPSNAFTLGKAKVGPRGAITLPVNAPGAGRFIARATFTVITHHGRRRVKTTFTYGAGGVRSAGQGTFKLVIGLRGRAARELKLLGSRQVTVTVTFTPTGGTPRHATKTLTVTRSRKGRYS